MIATLTAQLEHLGVQDQNPVFWIGAVFGGLVQITAGMLSYFIGDNFHFLVYNAFGWYWVVVPGFLLGEQTGVFEVTGAERGFFALIFAIIALGFVPAGAVHNTVLPVTLLLVSLGLGLQAGGAFTGVHGLGQAGAWALIAASALAAYMLAEKFYWLTLRRRVVPLGPPLITPAGDVES